MTAESDRWAAGDTAAPRLTRSFWAFLRSLAVACWRRLVAVLIVPVILAAVLATALDVAVKPPNDGIGGPELKLKTKQRISSLSRQYRNRHCDRAAIGELINRLRAMLRPVKPMEGYSLIMQIGIIKYEKRDSQKNGRSKGATFDNAGVARQELKTFGYLVRYSFCHFSVVLFFLVWYSF